VRGGGRGKRERRVKRDIKMPAMNNSSNVVFSSRHSQSAGRGVTSERVGSKEERV
jgi:hypothetical protein